MQPWLRGLSITRVVAVVYAQCMSSNQHWVLWSAPMNYQTRLNAKTITKVSKRHAAIILMLCGVGLLSACQVSSPQTSTASPVSSARSTALLQQYQWLYIAPKAAKAIVVNFQNNRVMINSGCNRLVGSWQTQAQQLQISPLAGTKMACAPVLMQQEQHAIALFSNQNLGFRINNSRAAPVLTLQHANGQRYTLIGQVP